MGPAGYVQAANRRRLLGGGGVPACRKTQPQPPPLPVSPAAAAPDASTSTAHRARRRGMGGKKGGRVSVRRGGGQFLSRMSEARRDPLSSPAVVVGLSSHAVWHHSHPHNESPLNHHRKEPGAPRAPLLSFCCIVVRFAFGVDFLITQASLPTPARPVLPGSLSLSRSRPRPHVDTGSEITQKSHHHQSSK